VLVHLVEHGDLIKIVLHLADNVGDEGRFDLFPFEFLPFNLAEVFVSFYLLDPSIAKSLQRVLLEQLVDQVDQARGVAFGKLTLFH